MSPYLHRISCISRCWKLRSFTTSAHLARPHDLYAALEISPQATPAEVKKSFYALSKRHHPDHNPSDPTATQRFLDISEAYAILSIPAKRHEYDRTVSQTHASSASASHRRASYASSTSSSPAGGRPASGLSRRRAQFRGPPPSFYRSGGWGSHAEKRRTAQGQTGPGTQTGEHRGGYPPHQESQYPFGEQNDVRHFDREAHYRTQQLQDQRRRWRTKMERQRVPMVDGKGIARDLCLIGGMLALIVMIPSMFWSKTKSGNDAAPRRRSQNGD